MGNCRRQNFFAHQNCFTELIEIWSLEWQFLSNVSKFIFNNSKNWNNHQQEKCCISRKDCGALCLVTGCSLSDTVYVLLFTLPLSLCPNDIKTKQIKSKQNKNKQTNKQTNKKHMVKRDNWTGHDVFNSECVSILHSLRSFNIIKEYQLCRNFENCWSLCKENK